MNITYAWVSTHKQKQDLVYKDRLTRINFDFIAKLFSEFGTTIVTVNDSIEKTTEQEFFEDLVSMIHSFSMKMYSKRKKKKLALVAQDLELEVSV